MSNQMLGHSAQLQETGNPVHEKPDSFAHTIRSEATLWALQERGEPVHILRRIRLEYEDRLNRNSVYQASQKTRQTAALRAGQLRQQLEAVVEELDSLGEVATAALAGLWVRLGFLVTGLAGMLLGLWFLLPAALPLRPLLAGAAVGLTLLLVLLRSRRVEADRLRQLAQGLRFGGLLLLAALAGLLLYGTTGSFAAAIPGGLLLALFGLFSGFELEHLLRELPPSWRQYALRRRQQHLTVQLEAAEMERVSADAQVTALENTARSASEALQEQVTIDVALVCNPSAGAAQKVA